MRTATAAAPKQTRRPRNNGQARRRHKAHPDQHRILPFAKSRLRPGEIGVVGFAGIGGWCTGWMEAVGVPPAIAVNHDEYAISVHKRNHPECRHLTEDMFLANIKNAVGRMPVGWGHFSPDCTDFSPAKGGKPVSKKIRGLAWVVLKWASEVSPRIVSVENVPAFAGWCPLIAKRCKTTRRVLKVGAPSCHAHAHHCAAPGERVPVEQQLLVRDPKRIGETFRRWRRQFESLGYVVEHRELKACDYGAATTRKRLFIIGRRDGMRIRWPKHTHAAPNDPRVLRGELLPFRTAAECIDFSDRGKSIFGRKKALATATERRVAEGVYRYVLKKRPFIVNLTHGARTEDIDSPIATVTGANRGEKAIVSPVLMSNNTNNAPRSVEDPIGTVTGGNRHFVIAPVIAKTHSNGSDREASGVRSADEPVGAILPKDGLAIVAPTLIQTSYGEREGQAPRVLDLHAPLGTVVAQGQKHSVVSAVFIAKHNDGNASYGISVDQPADTITRKDHHALVTAELVQQDYGSSQWQSPDAPLNTITQNNHHTRVSAGLVKLRGTSSTASAEEPAPTISAQGQHLGVVTAQIVEYYGTDQRGSIEEPIPTITTKDRFAVVSETLHQEGEDAGRADLLSRCARVAEFLERYIPGLHFPDKIVRVEIDGAIYVMVDIEIRMLRPRELARCQGFPDSYVLLGTITQQVGGIGNSVPPAFAKALAIANLNDEEPEELAA